MIKLAVTGACGRMGQRIIALGKESGRFEVVAALEHSAHEKLGEDIGQVAGIGPIGVKVAHELATPPEVMIDFSIPASSDCWIKYCVANNVPMVIGTTGFAEDQLQRLKDATQTIPMVFAANMGLGVNLLFKLVRQVAQTLDDTYDIEIDETHHRFKRDAPSGTAMELARQVAAGKEWPFPDCLTHGREGGDCLREEKTIGMHAIRSGDVVGIHNVSFSTLGETLTLSHNAHSRDTFVRGALHAGQWVTKQKPGLYNMFDVLGL